MYVWYRSKRTWHDVDGPKGSDDWEKTVKYAVAHYRIVTFINEVSVSWSVRKHVIFFLFEMCGFLGLVVKMTVNAIKGNRDRSPRQNFIIRT